MDIQNKSALTGMAASVLRPLIKVLIRHSFAHSELTELVRKTYVEVAYDAFAKPNRKLTYSRAALLTGLSRKEVVRLKNILNDEHLKEVGPNRLARRVVQAWLSDSNYVNENKQPKTLMLNGANHSFASLVSKYGSGATQEDVLQQLNKSGLTSQTDSETVNLIPSGYIPQYDEFEKIRVMSVCVSDLFNTAVHNTNTSNNDIRFQRQLVYSGIEESLAKKFHDVSSEKAIALFKTLNDFLFDGRAQSDPQNRKAGKRVGLGIYYFEGAKQVKSVKMTSEEHA